MGIHHHLSGLMFGLGMRLPRKSRDKTRTLHACVWCVLCDLMNYCVNDVYNMECYVLSDCVLSR